MMPKWWSVFRRVNTFSTFWSVFIFSRWPDHSSSSTSPPPENLLCHSNTWA